MTLGLTGAGQRETGVLLAEDEIELARDQGGKGGAYAALGRMRMSVAAGTLVT